MVYVSKRRTEIPKLDSSIQVPFSRFAELAAVLQFDGIDGTVLIDGGHHGSFRLCICGGRATAAATGRQQGQGENAHEKKSGQFFQMFHRKCLLSFSEFLLSFLGVQE